MQPAEPDAYGEGMGSAVTEVKWDTLGGRMIEARTRRGLSRRQAADALGYASTSTILRLERNEVTLPQEQVVFRFANEYGCSRVWLMYGRGEPEWSE